MGAFSFAWTASGIPEAFLERSGVPLPTRPGIRGFKNVSNTAYLSLSRRKISTAKRVDNWHYVYQT
jgi:hypothetical protein